MATADDALADSIWLRDALALAVAALGSEALAKERLTEWLAAGELPWTCMQWNGLDAEGIAKLKQKSSAGAAYFVPTSRRARSSRTIRPYPPAAYCSGDPQFWSALGLEVDWEDDRACETYVIGGAEAEGIKVSRTRLLELLPTRARAHG
jgi:hypothetical protein